MNRIAELRSRTRAALCLDCGKCTSACPLAAIGDFSARRIARQSLEGTAGTGGDGLRRCLTCAACETLCPEGVAVTDFVMGLRELLPAAHRAPCPHGGVFQALARSMAGPTPPERSTAWIDADLRVAEEGPVALFVGCLPSFELYFGESLDVHPLDIARSAIRVLNHLGIEPVVVADERCCGHDLLWSGDRESFAALARANAEAFTARGVEHLITTCAECCRTWRRDYPEAAPGLKLTVEHLSEFLAARVAAGEVRFRADGPATLTYQDACRLGRHLGVTDAPRAVLDALPGARRVEMDRSGRDAACCGTSGFLHCDADSRLMQSRRLAEAEATGADVLVTSCPKCLIHFSCALAEDRRRGLEAPAVEVEDLTVLAASLLMDARAHEPALTSTERTEEPTP